MHKLHLVIVVLNTILGFRPCTQYVTKEMKPLASLAIKTTGEIAVPQLVVL